MPTDPQPRVPADGPWSDFLGRRVARKLLCDERAANPCCRDRRRSVGAPGPATRPESDGRQCRELCVRRGIPGIPSAAEARLRRAGPAYAGRSEEHTSELQSLMRISYAVFCLQKKQDKHNVDKHLETSQI